MGLTFGSHILGRSHGKHIVCWQAQRRRTFFIALADGCKLFQDSLMPFLSFMTVTVSVKVCLECDFWLTVAISIKCFLPKPCVQENFLLPLDTFFEERFNELNELPMQVWMNQDRPTEEEKNRLKLLGNIVIPQCGRLAAAIFHRLIKDPEEVS